MSKAIVCRCEDVSVADLQHAVDAGYSDLEEVKRFTGYGTGPCQGKECGSLVACEMVRILCKRGNVEADVVASMQPFTARSPLQPTPLRALSPAEILEDPFFDRTPEVPHIAAVAATSVSTAAVIATPGTAVHTNAVATHVDTLIIGAGVMGLSIAYYLTRLGAYDLALVDSGYIAGGASGRNGGGIRQQWSTEINVRLMQESVALCRDFATETGVNNWFRQGGYLFIARSDKEVQKLRANCDIQNRLGVGTQLISPQQAQDIVPELSLHDVVGASYNATDGIVFPWPFMWGYAAKVKEHGVQIHTHTKVTAIARMEGRYHVKTTQGNFVARRVINAAGAWSKQISQMLGITLPTWPIRHEICSSEPLKPFLGPMVSDLSCGLYCSQSMRGEIVGGCTVPDHGETYDMRSTSRFLSTYAARLSTLMPILGDVKILRQWAGPYEQSPDGNPILGDTPEFPEFYFAAGFVGHGFMMAPVIGKHYAAWLASDHKDVSKSRDKHEVFSRYDLARFRDGRKVEREDFNIG